MENFLLELAKSLVEAMPFALAFGLTVTGIYLKVGHSRAYPRWLRGRKKPWLITIAWLFASLAWGYCAYLLIAEHAGYVRSALYVFLSCAYVFLAINEQVRWRPSWTHEKPKSECA